MRSYMFQGNIRQNLEKKHIRVDRLVRFSEWLKKWQKQLFLWGTIPICIGYVLNVRNIIEFDLISPGGFWLIMAGLGFLLIHASEYLKQIRTDLRAAIIREQIKHNKEKAKFALYLRPFGSTGLVAKNPLHKKWWLAFGGAGFPQHNMGREKGYEMETHIEDILGDDCPLIALGEKGETQGAGRITTLDESWKTEILEWIFTRERS